MNVIFYNFNKRINSTARPTGSGTTIACIIKEGSSQLAPTIRIKWSSGAAPVYNYAYISAFGGRYYFVTDWTFEDRQWTASLTVDVLATYKTSIGSLTKYILRSASAENTDALDNIYPAVSEYSEYIKVGNFTDWGNYSVQGSGHFVITCIGDTNTSKGTGVSQYQMGAVEVSNLIKNAYSSLDNEWNVAQDTIKSVLLMPTRFFSDISKFLTSVMWFPCSFVEDDTISESIHLSFYNVTNSTYHPLKTAKTSGSYDLDLRDWPTTGSRKWEWLSPYASYTLEAQPWGTIDLDGNDIVNCDTLRVMHSTDSLTGLSRLDVFAITGSASPRLIATRTAQLGVAVPYGGSSPNVGGMIGGFVGIASAVAGTIEKGKGLFDIAASMGSAAAASAATGYASGTSGGGASIAPNHVLYCRRLHHVDLDPTEAGYPLAEMRQISTLSGFVQCKDGDITSLTATDSELMQVKSYLEGGFFYE